MVKKYPKRLTDEEVLKEHPSLKGRITDFSKDKLLFSDRYGYTKYASLGQIHETQLDKAKVKEAVSPLLKELEKHIGREGTITITKPMCEIIVHRLKELIK